REDEWVVEVPLGTGQGSIPMALGWSPGWTAEVDGKTLPTHRTHDGRLGVELPVGADLVTLRFEESALGPASRAVSTATAGALLASAARSRPGRHSARSRRERVGNQQAALGLDRP